MNPKERAVCVCFDGGRVLLMRRIKNGRRYTVLPGGGIELGEAPGEAAVREFAEETGLVATVTGDLVTVEHDDRRAHYLLMTASSGEPTLGGPEALAQSEDNRYWPVWVPVSELVHEPLVPEEAREIVLRAFAGRLTDGVWRHHRAGNVEWLSGSLGRVRSAGCALSPRRQVAEDPRTGAAGKRRPRRAVSIRNGPARAFAQLGTHDPLSLDPQG